MQNSKVLNAYEISELNEYLQKVKDIKGLRLCLYIMFMRYHIQMAGSYHGIDNELDSDFYADFANLLEVLFILSHGDKDREITHY